MITRGIRLALLLAGLFAAGCSTTDLAVPVSNPGAPVPFRASSLDNDFFAFVGTFEGTYTLEADAVEVFVQRATVQLRRKTVSDGPRHLSALRLGLGYGSTMTRWGTLSRSEPVPTGRVFRPGDEVTLDSLYFRIPIPELGWELGRSWIVFEMEETRPDEDGRPGGPAWAYAHGRRLDGSPP